MRPENKYTPFDGNIEVMLLDANLEPLPIANYDDVEVHLLVNGTEKVKYKAVAATGWKAWSDANATDGNVINCPVTVEETQAWRGLVKAVTVLVKDDERHEPIVKVLFLAAKSGV